MNLNKSQWFLLLLMLLAVSFFGIPSLDSYRMYINLFCVSILLTYFFNQYNVLKTFTEGKLLCLYMLLFLISCGYSIVMNGQSPISMYQGVLSYLGILTFVFCLKNRFTYKNTKQILTVFAISFCVCYIIQWIIYPSIIFSGASEESINDQMFRMRLPASLGSFYIFLTGVNYILKTKFYRAALFILLGGIPIIVMGFRSLTVFTIVGSILMYLLNSRHNLKSIGSGVIGIIAAIAISQTDLFTSKIEEMSYRQDVGGTFLNEDYVRWVELDFYQSKFDKPGEWLLGAGVPCGASTYATQLNSFREFGMYWEDLGLVGLSMIIGIITVCILVLWSLRMMGRCGHQDLSVERMTMFVALFGSIITSMEYFRPGNFMILGLLFYCEYIRNQELGALSDKFWLRKRDYNC